MAFFPQSGPVRLGSSSGSRKGSDITRDVLDPNVDLVPFLDFPFNNSRPSSSSDSGLKILQQGSSGSTGRVGNDADPERPAVLGTSTTTGGSGSYSPEDMAYLDEQESSLNRQYGRTDSALVNALNAILQNYNKELNSANLTRGRNLEDFNTKTQLSEQGRARELGKVDTRSRMLADSLRQRLGMAGGSGSSAYQLTAPRAVQRQASQERGDVLTNYAANFQNLDTNKRRAGEDYDLLLDELQKQRTAREGGVRGDIEEQRNQIREGLGQVAGQRAAMRGGGAANVRSAMSPYQSQIQQGESLIDSIFNKYAAKYNVNPLQVRETNLRDYATDPAALRDNAVRQEQNQYAPFRPYNRDDEELY